MTTTSEPRSRRSILAAAAGVAGGALATTLGRPLDAKATVAAMETGTDNTADAPTRLLAHINGVVLGVATPTMPPYAQGREMLAIGTDIGFGPALSVTVSADNTEAGVGMLVSALAQDGIGIEVDAGIQGIVSQVHEEFGAGVVGKAEGDQALGVAGSGSGSNTVGVGGSSSGDGGTGVLGVAQGKGTGGEFRSEHGTGLKVTGPVRFNRSGRALVPVGRSYVDIVVPGGMSASSSTILATIQTYRPGVSVAGVKLNYPTTGKARIYLTKVASTTATTPVGWFVLS